MLLDGVNHVAVLTKDTDRLHAFYRDVFDATVSHDQRPEDGMRLSFIDVGPHTELNVFELTGNAEADHQTPMFGRGRLDHMGLQAASLDAFTVIRDRLIGCGATDGFVTDFGPDPEPVLHRSGRARGRGVRREPRPPARRRAPSRHPVRPLPDALTWAFAAEVSPYRPVGRLGDMIDLVHDLEPTVGELLDRHLAASKEWFPHEVVPWGQGRDFDPAEAWDPDEHPVPDAVRSALFVNLLTEDNLPYYFSTINRMFGADGAWGTWARRWTAEEGRHSIAIRDYLMVTRLLDPRELERARMHQVGTGVVPEPDLPIDGLVYVALQELATRIAHRATGRLLEDRAGYDVMARVATDENHHFLFYRDLTSAALAARPVQHGEGDRAAGARLRDARHRHPRLRGARARHRQGGHLRPADPPRPDPRARRAAPLGRRRARRPRRRGRAGRAPGCSSGSSASAGPGSASPSAGPVGAARNRCWPAPPRSRTVAQPSDRWNRSKVTNLATVLTGGDRALVTADDRGGQRLRRPGGEGARRVHPAPPSRHRRVLHGPSAG